MDRQTEERIIELAVERGFVGQAKLAEVLAQSTPASPSQGGHQNPGFTLRALIERGLLSESDVRALESELGEGACTQTTPLSDSRGHHTALVEAGNISSDIEEDLKTRSLQTVVHRLNLASLANWGRYQVECLLGRGGMGEVYKAFDPKLRRNVALKFLYKEDPEMGARFVKEAQAQARVDHEYICRVYEVGEHLGHPFIAMQLISGQNLSEARATLTVEEKARVIMQVASALHVAHKQGLIHRDVKPSNIMVERSEDGKLHPFVMDFGLARELASEGLTMTGEVMGTPAFMSPEQARGRTTSLDRRTDIYALGATLYDLLAGNPPFSSPSSLETLMRILNEEPRPLRQLVPSVPLDLETIIMKCLEKETWRRYDSCLALAQDIERFLEGEPIEARPSTWWYRFIKRAKKNPLVTTLAASVVIVAIAAAGFAYRERIIANAQARLAGEYGQQVNGIQQTMRFAYLAPLHDVRKEKAAAKREIERLAERIEHAGKAGKGPGNFAIGIGYLAVEGYDLARKYLELAWQDGYHNPEVAAALGRTFSELYQEALENADKIANVQARNQSKQEAESDFKIPALAFFALAEERRAGWIDYQLALVAMLEKKWDAALTGARKAQSELSWLYEASRLEGEVMYQLGREEQSAGRYDEAISRFRAALTKYETASEIARSDETCHRRVAKAWNRIMTTEILRGGDAKSPFENALAAYDKAFVANPESSETSSSKSLLLCDWSEFESTQGKNPENTINQAVAMAAQAIRFDPTNEKAHYQLGYSYWKLAEFMKGHRVDSRPSLEKAIGAYENALKLNSKTGHNGMGLALWTLGEEEIARNVDSRLHFTKAIEHFKEYSRLYPKDATGWSNAAGVYRRLAYVDWEKNIDPTPFLDQAIDCATKATQINPRMTTAYINMATTSLDKGMYLVQKGKDPSAAYNTALTGFARAAELNPKNALAFTNLSYTHRSQAQFELSAGRDPLPSINNASAAARKAIEINPAYSGAYRALAAGERVRAEFALDNNQDPTDTINQVRGAIRKATEVGGERTDALLYIAETEIVAARFAIKSGQSPQKALFSAEKWLQRAQVMDETNAWVYLHRAELNYRLAEWQMTQDLDPRKTIASGIIAAEKALSIDGDVRQAAALTGVFRTLQARGEKDTIRKGKLAREAVVILTPLLAQDHYFNSLYADRLAEALQLAREATPEKQSK